MKKWIKSLESCDISTMRRVWKAIFYCYWLSDKPLVQKELSERIAGLISFFDSDSGTDLLFIKCFGDIIRLEWIRIDKFRLDKFYSLLRLMFRGSLQWCQEREWSEDSVNAMWGVWGVFDEIQAGSTMSGPSRFLCENLLVEAARCLEGTEEIEKRHLCLVRCVSPVLVTYASSPSAYFCTLIEETLLTTMMDWFCGEPSDLRSPPAALGHLCMELGESADTRARARKVLFAIGSNQSRKNIRRVVESAAHSEEPKPKKKRRKSKEGSRPQGFVLKKDREKKEDSRLVNLARSMQEQKERAAKESSFALDVARSMQEKQEKEEKKKENSQVWVTPQKKVTKARKPYINPTVAALGINPLKRRRIPAFRAPPRTKV